MSLRLDATYVPDHAGAGAMHVRLVNAGPSTLRAFRLALTSVVQLTPKNGAATALVARTSGYHELVPPVGLELPPGGVWQLDPLACGHRPEHANDGPASAFVILADGSTRPVQTGATDRIAVVRVGRETPPTLHRADGGDAVAGAWVAAALCERRVQPHDAPVLSDAPSGAAVSIAIDDALGPEAFRIDDGDRIDVAAGSPRAVCWALLTLARHRRNELVQADGVHEPAHAWRGLHVDVARQFLPTEDVRWLIETAGWLRMNRLHLHLTDDEGWRIPIAAYAALTSVGAWRGHGLPIPPLLGTGAEPTGGWYSADDIARWVARAGELGIDVIPEIDLPGHSFAALAAIPSLTDPDDRSGARSVQHFVDNVLNPGVPATWPFLERVVGEVAGLFPSPWLHIGGDEVPPGAWQGSPAAQRWAAEQGIDDIAIGFVRRIVDVVRRTTGRRVGVWQEAAGALDPDDGYVVAWKSIEDARRLVAAGHDVVAAPAEAYYLDMAVDAGWSGPGASWAGNTSLADIEAFDVTEGWSEEERAGLLGIQACLWTEHVHDRATLRHLVTPRLDTIADAAWLWKSRF